MVSPHQDTMMVIPYNPLAVKRLQWPGISHDASTAGTRTLTQVSHLPVPFSRSHLIEPSSLWPPAMNWTGGRLYRHSNNNHNAVPKSLKTDSQRFRSSITKDSNWIPFSHLPSSIAAGKPAEEQTQKTGGSDLIQASSARPSPLQPPRNGHPPFESSHHSQPVSRLDCIKHQLLNTKDWASVAVTKPLEVEFTQTEEIERFGKRRKLTDADRKRLADTENNVSWTEWPFHKKNAGGNMPSEMRTIKNLTIKINGRTVSAEALPEECNILQTNVSSQSMLLDHEGSGYSRRSETARLSSPRGVEGIYLEHVPARHSPASRLSPCPLSPDVSKETDPRSGNSSLDVVETTSADEEVPIIEQMPPQTQNHESSNKCQIQSSKRRFTIDDQMDQMIAENERRLNATTRVTKLIHEPNPEQQKIFYDDSIISPKTRKSMDYFSRRATQTQEDLWCPSDTYDDGAPEPFYNRQRTMRNESSYRKNSGILSLLRPRETDILQLPTSSINAYTSPTKIFGQPVQLGNDDSLGLRQPMAPSGFHTDRMPYFELIGASSTSSLDPLSLN